MWMFFLSFPLYWEGIVFLEKKNSKQTLIFIIEGVKLETLQCVKAMGSHISLKFLLLPLFLNRNNFESFKEVGIYTRLKRLVDKFRDRNWDIMFQKLENPNRDAARTSWLWFWEGANEHLGLTAKFFSLGMDLPGQRFIYLSQTQPS